jgi:hypothetical protein
MCPRPASSNARHPLAGVVIAVTESHMARIPKKLASNRET